jgi:hypothetical protein
VLRAEAAKYRGELGLPTSIPTVGNACFSQLRSKYLGLN